MKIRITSSEGFLRSARRVADEVGYRFRLRMLINFGVCVLIVPLSQAQDLPPSLRDAMTQVQAGDGERASGVLRRFAFTDNSEQRLAARVSLARLDRVAGRLDRAATWVEEYQNPRSENYEWPRIEAYVEAAAIQFLQGNAFDSVKMLTDANQKASGLGKITVERTLSWLVEQKPDLQQALDYEKAALKSGEAYFKRKKISDTAGLEPPKPGADHWKELKPEIEERIADIERRLAIDRYGLDYVLYREAQEFRNASHPLALDFTNVAAAFNKKGEIGGKVPNADYEMAAYRYNEIVEFFPENPYGQAAKLYIAVCTAKTGDPDDAIKQLKAFYREDPDGLYRGEALKFMGDLYLFSKWDKVNAREAYERTIRWVDATKGRTRVLETYLVPEKSAKISKPPEKVKSLTSQGEIKQIEVKSNALVNRLTSQWYLDALLVESEWRLGFLSLTDEDWDLAFQHFDQTLSHDAVLNKAHQGRFFNPYDRLKIGKGTGAIVGTQEQSKGLNRQVKMVIYWADFQLMLENFDEALSLYRRIQGYSENVKDGVAHTRAVLGEMLVRRQTKNLDRVPDITRMHNLVLEYPNSPSAPYLLELCALITRGEPLPTSAYFQQIYTNYPDSFFAPRARYNEILRGSEGREHEKRKAMINKFIKDYPNETNYIDALKRLDARIISYYKEGS